MSDAPPESMFDRLWREVEIGRARGRIRACLHCERPVRSWVSLGKRYFGAFCTEHEERDRAKRQAATSEAQDEARGRPVYPGR